MNWRLERIEDICTGIVSGGTPLTSKENYYAPEEIPWLKTKEVNYSRIYSTETFISREGLNNSSAKLIPPHSVIMAMYGQGDTAGRVAINMIPLATNQACCNMLINPDIADYEYVFYCLSTMYDEIVRLKTGPQPNLSAKKIRDFRIPLPSLSMQHTIAGILRAYDNLIENNRRQIALLEEAADLIYGEWLAGCDDSSFKTGVMSDFFDVTIGKTPPRSQSECFVSEGIPWASVKDLGATNGAYISSTSECLTQDAVDSYNVKVKPAGTILLSFKLTIGRVAIAEQPIATNEAIAHFETDDDAVCLYTYEYLRNFDYDTLGSTSSIGKAINSNIVKSIPFFMPDADSLDRFHSQLNPVFRLMRYCQRRVALLSESRNLLLPKLMSGEIEV